MAKRQELSLKEKIEVLDKIKKQSPNSSQREFAEVFKIPRSTLTRLIKKEKEIRSSWREVTSHGHKPTTKLKRLRKGKEPEVDTALNQWFDAVTSKGEKLSGRMLKEKAEDLAKKLGHRHFIATEGWLSRWKARHHIRYKRAHGEKASADISSAEEWIKSVLPDLLEKYRPNNVYNADETGLYYRATPDGSLCYRHEKLSGSKKAMERITVLCCSNMTGTDKCKLLVIGKSFRPRCFKNVNLDNLPVTYLANKNAWMTSVIFTDWLAAWDLCLTRENRKILLIVDNCSAHPHVSTLENIQLEVLPPNTTPLIQPMDQGIIKNLKTLYRKELVQMTVAYIEGNMLNPSSTAIDVSSKVSILDAVNFVAKSWRAVKEATILNCFRKSGFFSLSLSVPDDNDEELSFDIPEISNGEEYNEIDAKLPCHNESDTQEEIVESIIARRPCLQQSDDDGSDNDDETDPVPVTHAEAKLHILGLQRYFTEQGFDNAAHSRLDECAHLVHLRSTTSQKQTSYSILSTK